MTKEKIDISYKQLFGSSNGKKVLADLESFCGFNESSVRLDKIDPNEVLFREGKRRVFVYIKRKIENG